MRYGYPTLIRDNFFTNPDEIVELANKFEYYSQANGDWPGKRTKNLLEVDPNFFNHICGRILNNYYNYSPIEYTFSAFFQKSSPYDGDKYDLKNLGWVHVDQGIFGGLIYLTKNPEENTGTSLFDLKNSYWNYPEYVDQVKRRHYLQDETLTNQAYSGAYEFLLEQFQETVSVQSKYNRLFAFDGNQYHALQSIGTKERLTLVFFCKHLLVDDRESYHSSRILG